MKPSVFALLFCALVSGCGGSSESASPFTPVADDQESSPATADPVASERDPVAQAPALPEPDQLAGQTSPQQQLDPAPTIYYPNSSIQIALVRPRLAREEIVDQTLQCTRMLWSDVLDNLVSDDSSTASWLHYADGSVEKMSISAPAPELFSWSLGPNGEYLGDSPFSSEFAERVQGSDSSVLYRFWDTSDPKNDLFSCSWGF
ncbi:hypothetical protein AB833_25195 [Chromatiales bacterium (ex Bugula neritina AB1)]|nr:hypothetical protein AB833_25195 [Chromatiales bacterium (ex Bugula neritina AB1)]